MDELGLDGTRIKLPPLTSSVARGNRENSIVNSKSSKKEGQRHGDRKLPRKK